MQCHGKTAWAIVRPDNDHNETIELVLRLGHQIAHVLSVYNRRARRAFWMSVPVANEMKASCVPFENLRLLTASVGPEAKPATNIATTRRRRLDYDCVGPVKLGE